MSGALGLGYNQSRQDSTSSSGLPSYYRNLLGPEVFGLGRTASNLAQQYAGSRFGYFQGKPINQLVPTNEFGLPAETTGALEAIANKYFSRASAGGAMAGQLQPESTPGIVGSALTNLGGTLLPYITDFKKYVTELPDRLRSARLGYLNDTIGAETGLLGTESKYRGRAFGFDVKASGGAGGPAPSIG